jgi:tRNA dimethylallyltransferase
MNITETIEKFLSNAKKPLLVVLGATATGKTNLSLSLAEKFKGEIISTDSRQIYQHMPISTDVILEEERKGIIHHMLEIVEPDKTLTLAEFKDMAKQKIEKVHNKKALPILVGGTGLYISAIIDNYDMPRVAPNVELREKLEKEAAEHGNEYIHSKLKDLDPESAKNIHPNNLRYLIRAIEVVSATGQEKVDLKGESPYDILLLGITRDREEIYQRINDRVDQQIENGLLEEVKALVENGYDENLPSMSSLGVKEIIPYLKDEMSLEECKEILKRNTRKYAKRQLTWMRRYDNVLWLKPEELKELTSG